MSDAPSNPPDRREPAWLSDLLRKQPEFVYLGPFMLYLVLLGLNDRVPEEYMPIAIAIRGIGGLWAVWLVRHHLPPMGKPHVMLGLFFGLVAAAAWVLGQYLFNAIGLGGSLFGIFSGEIFQRPEAVDPRESISTTSWYAQAVLRIAVASITVPVVEELFWRAFMLRAFIDWNHFDRVPMGKFTWFSFIGTSLMSMLQHPANWGTSIFCWMLFNGLFYWKTSLWFLIIVHGSTNLFLYIYVIATGDWQFW